MPLVFGAALLSGTVAWGQTADQPPLPAPKPPAADGPKTPGPPELGVYEGRPIRSVVLQRPAKPLPESPEVKRFEPVEAQIDQVVRSQLRAGEGSPYQQETVSADITRLNRLGRFKQVENRVQLLDDGTVVLVYTLVPQPVVRAVQSVGNKRLSDQDIAKEVDILKDTAVDPFQLAQACRRIEQLYREKGFYLAQVTVDEQALEESGIVLFRVREGERLKVTEIRFEGNRSFTPSELSSGLKTKTAWLFDKGALDEERLDQDVATIVQYYRDRGYLDVRASRTVRPSVNGAESVVTFLVEEGRLYTLRSLTLLSLDHARMETSMEAARASLQPGEHILTAGPGAFEVYRYGVFTPEQASGLMDIKPGDVYSQRKLKISMDSVKAAFGKLGYSDVTISRRELRDPVDPTVDILLMVTEGQKYRLGEIVIQGDGLTRDRVIRRELTVRPERPADMTEIEESKRRIERLQLFERGSVKMTLQDPDPQDPTHRPLLVEVTETNTGNFSIGAALSSDSGVVGRIAITQRNFDVSDSPDTFGEFFSGRAFRGGGQTFSIEALPGTQTEIYRISLSEPSLFETSFSGSGSLYYTERDYDEFDERRIGTRVGVGRRFGSRWTASMPIRVEEVTEFNIAPDQAVDVFAYEGKTQLSSVGLTISRATIDDQFRPTKGNAMEFGFEQYGVLGGDLDFTALHAEYRTFFKLDEDYLDRKTILGLRVIASYIPQDKDGVPVYERYYLGGQSFRGFRYRTVSPVGIRNDTGTQGDDPVGGTYSFFAGAEVTKPVFEDIFGLAAFIDSGTVTYTPGFEDYRVSVGFGVRLFIKGLSPAPLAFDFGFPIMSAKTDHERVFSFSVDLPWK